MKTATILTWQGASALLVPLALALAAPHGGLVQGAEPPPPPPAQKAPASAPSPPPSEGIPSPEPPAPPALPTPRGSGPAAAPPALPAPRGSDPARAEPPAPPQLPQESPAAAMISEGMELLERGSLQAASALFEKAAALDPASDLARARLAYVRFRLADFAGARKSAEQALALDPTDSVAWLILGRAKQALRDDEGARAAFTAAADLEPKVVSQERLVASALSLYLRAMQAVERGDWAAAESDHKDVVRIYPKNGYGWYEYGLALLKGGHTADALEALTTAEQINETFRPAETWVYPNRRYYFLSDNLRFWQGVALRQLGRHDEAVASFERIYPRVESLAGATTTLEPPPGAVALEGRVENSFRAAFHDAALALEAKGEKAKALDLLKRYQRLRLADEDLNQKVKELQKRLK